MSLNAFPGLNLATLLAGICIFLWVAGLIPVLAFLLITPKVPKPVKTTDLPPLSDWPTDLIKASNAFLQEAFGNFATLDICSINFALFINFLFDLFKVPKLLGTPRQTKLAL